MNPTSTAVCPAIASYEPYFSQANNPTSDHTACFGAYLTGAAGANVSDTLGGCCNNTVTVVEMDAINNYDNPDPGYVHCWYYCNVSQWTIEETTAEGFFAVEECMQKSPSNWDYDYNERFGKYQIKCFPKRSNAAVSLSFAPLSTAAFGLMLLVTGAIVLA